MERKLIGYWAAQFIGWGAYYFLSIVLLLYTHDIIVTNTLIVWLLGSIITSIILTHVIRFYIIKRDIIRAKIFTIVIHMFILAIISAAILELFQDFFYWLIGGDFLVLPPGMDMTWSFDWGTYLYAVSRSLILFMVWIGFYFVFVIIERSRTQEMDRLKYEASMNEIELKNLRAQLNPHFLFNSLNSIRALVGLEPETAKDAITKLSSMLRLSINMGKHRLTSVREEMELVKSYLELEKIRFEERLEIEIRMDRESGNCKIPPLMIQTLVENAIKHGISKSINGGVVGIELHCKDNALIGKVKNTGIYKPDHDVSGIGLSNTKKRLEILYGENAEFGIHQAGDKVHVDFKIDYKKL